MIDLITRKPERPHEGGDGNMRIEFPEPWAVGQSFEPLNFLEFLNVVNVQTSIKLDQPLPTSSKITDVRQWGMLAQAQLAVEGQPPAILLNPQTASSDSSSNPPASAVQTRGGTLPAPAAVSRAFPILC